MRPLEAAEIADLETYARLRPDYRSAVIRHKRDRRMSAGERVTLLFEDRETLRFQVQEMLFVERIGEARRIQHELDVYNELMPGECELSATLFIEITDLAEIRPELDRLIGLDEHVSIAIGTGIDAQHIRADFDPKQLEDDRIAAVQYIRFRLSAGQAERFADPAVPAAIHIDHPAYRVEAPIPEPVRTSLAAGLFREPAPLLEPGDVARPQETLLFQDDRVHARRLPGGAGRVHVVVEARDPQAPVDDALWHALCDAVRRAAEQVARERGRAQVRTELGADTGPPRWHVVSAEERG